ncbi:acyl-CoA carboxylase subunit beta [Bradymonas sediminis]|nr:acyl-CoA carboxylase subunit beta [Bradymonas sediminis]TDP73556.1 acetyl-CoA carboxylase carboxyltransferase component [Bradymonas sediminis]
MSDSKKTAKPKSSSKKKPKAARTNQKMRALVEELHARREDALQMGGERRVARQHAKGKLDVRQRIDYLFDPGTFVEFGQHAFFHSNGTPVAADNIRTPGDGMVSGWGEINGRIAVCAAYDFTVLGGSIGDINERKVTRCREFALKNRVPMIWLIDSAGARVHGGSGIDFEQITLFSGSGYLFREQVAMSGVVPQVAAMLGPGAAGTAYIPGLADYVPMVDGTSFMALGGPPLVKAAVGEDVEEQDLGGAKIHNKFSGVADQSFESDEACLDSIKQYLSYLPQNCEAKPQEIPHQPSPERAPGGATRENLLDVLPESSRRGYDMKKLLGYIVDDGELFEMKPQFARQIVTAFARIDGKSVGIVASNPGGAMGGALDNDSADKAARFVNLCDSFNIPLIFFQDVPGFMVGSRVEKAGIIRHGAKMLYEVSRATVPKITVIVRKAYGAGYYVMCGRAYEPDLIVAWPTAEISVMGPAGMVEIFARSMGRDATLDQTVVDAQKKQMIAMIEPHIDIYKVAGRALIDEVIDPRETRDYIVSALKLSANKKVERPWRKSGVRPV